GSLLMHPSNLCPSPFHIFNNTAPSEIYTLSPTRRSSDLDLVLQGQRGVGVVRHVGDGEVVDHEGPGQAQQRQHQEGELAIGGGRSEEHTSELQSRENLVCRLLLEKKKKKKILGCK